MARALIEGVVEPGGGNLNSNTRPTQVDVQMEDSQDRMRTDYMEGNTKGNPVKAQISYKDAFLNSTERWSNCFQEWGIEDLESNLDNLNVEGEIPIEHTKEIPYIEIDLQTKKRIIQPWKYCLIGKVVGKTVGYKYMSAKTREMWKLVGKMQVLDMGCDFFMFKFEKPEDFKHALLEGP
ncbi:hypothetical protein MKX03_025758, partial [Papaver bracteatum]